MSCGPTVEEYKMKCSQKQCFGADTEEFQNMLKADDQTWDEATCHQGKSR